MASNFSETIGALQLLYGTLRKEQSPKRLDDFQVICSSIPEANMAEIGPIVDHLRGAGRRGVRIERIFFSTSRWMVVGQILQTATKDNFNRPQYLAHVLLLEHDDFARIDNDPCRIWDGFDFVEDSQIAANKGNECQQSSTLLPPAELPVLWPQGPEPAFWKALGSGKTKSLIRVIEGIHRGDGITLQLSGSEQTISTTIRELFRVMPVSYRPQFTFDTSFCGDSNEPRTEQCPYRIIGSNPGVRPNIRGFRSCVVETDCGGNSDEYKRNSADMQDDWMDAALSCNDYWQHLDEIFDIPRAFQSLFVDGIALNGIQLSTALLKVNHSGWLSCIREQIAASGYACVRCSRTVV